MRDTRFFFFQAEDGIRDQESCTRASPDSRPDSGQGPYQWPGHRRKDQAGTERRRKEPVQRGSEQRQENCREAEQGSAKRARSNDRASDAPKSGKRPPAARQ